VRDGEELEIVGDFFSDEPYGMAMRKGEADFKTVVDAGLKGLIRSGKYFEFYDKWFGSKSEVPYPLTAKVRKFIEDQAK